MIIILARAFLLPYHDHKQVKIMSQRFDPASLSKGKRAKPGAPRSDVATAGSFVEDTDKISPVDEILNLSSPAADAVESLRKAIRAEKARGIEKWESTQARIARVENRFALRMISRSLAVLENSYKMNKESFSNDEEVIARTKNACKAAYAARHDTKWVRDALNHKKKAGGEYGLSEDEADMKPSGWDL
ncbi:hypothetical protein MKZ38_008816 [Zalerion maritima]|uniref:Uncharacterized protein n=1 Tax=Zalerion maritima TaxID=339359 RepID=A0AAD5RV26_9PEZI|nr:hypothetical protein MKZ38_008816 [Zalerion maritima]